MKLALAVLCLALALPGAAAADVPVHPDSGLGEPQVEVNPLDPSDIVIGENNSGVSVSRDGGATWKQVSLSNPGDNVLAVEPDGTFVYSALDGDVWSSHDGGSSWSIVGNWVGAVAAQGRATEGTGLGPVAAREVACNTPEPEGPGSPEGPGPHLIGCDRPWLVADPQTGTLYASFTDHDDNSGGVGANGWELGFLACRSTVLTNPAFNCGRQYVASSADGGHTWSSFSPFDSSDYPAAVTGGFSGGPVAAGGVLATSYVAAAAPGRSSCPCVVFETSRDHGITWDRRAVPTSVNPADILPTEQSTLFEPYTAADPSHPGRFAVMLLDPDQTHLLVFVTSDDGATWDGPARLAEAGDGEKRYLPWIAYGPTGALGVVWRTEYSDGSYAAWAAVSPQGDSAFDAPVSLSSERSPGPVSQLAADDASDVTMTANTLHAAWGDRRSGQLGIRYGSYRFAP